MVKIKKLTEEVEILEGVNVEIEDSIIKVKSDRGEIQRKLICPKIEIYKQDNKIILEANNATKREKVMINTFRSHIKNLIKGVTKDYIYKLKVCSGHFPMNLLLEKNKLLIKNFMGEKIPRKANIVDNVEVKLEGDVIIVSGMNKEKVGQTASNIELATRITGKDRRVFQDGIFITSKAGKEIK